MATLASECAGDDADGPAVRERPALDRMAEYVHSEGAPGVALLVRNRSGTWRAASGLAVVDPPRPLRARHRFRVASVTKTFTATIVLQLVGEGRLALDDPIDRRLPGVVPPGRAITIRQILGLLVERVTGQPLGRVFAGRIFEPLGLRATSFEEAPGVPPSIAHGYALQQVGSPVGGDGARDVAESLDGAAWADGAIVSTPDDLATFYGALLGGKLLDREVLAEMTRTVPGDVGGSGLGLFRFEVSCGAAWGHGGSMVGYLTQVFAGREGRHVVVAVATGNTARIASALRATAAAAYCTS